MTSPAERKTIVDLIQTAMQGGARLEAACAACYISVRTYRRWYRHGVMQVDQRPEVSRPPPPNKLSQEKREHIVEVCTTPEYASLSPMQIVPDLLDKGVYIASESTFYRVLHDHSLVKHRGRAKAAVHRAKPTTFVATAPKKVWTWDITYLPSPVKGLYFYLYLIEDLFSRKIVGAHVYAVESGKHAAQFLQQTLIAERCTGQSLVLHSDNGAPMKSQTMRAKVQDLGLTSSFSRPRVSDDNPYVESLFRTLKYCPQWPGKGFENLAAAQQWVDSFVVWYNTKHRHSKIKFVTPDQKHKGLDVGILKKREQVLQEAKQQYPERWYGRNVRNCSPVKSVALNPEKEVKTA